MDAATHVLLGALVAQLPGRVNQSKQVAITDCLGFWQKSLLGGIAALIPDIDYVVFVWDPLEFLAYWHRAESHSLLVAPILAFLFCYMTTMFDKFRQYKAAIFWIALLAIYSHLFIDSLTTFGTQWFAPMSDQRISWNLLFVIDPYFSLTILLGFAWLCRRKQHWLNALVYFLPVGYLAFVAGCKYTLHQQIIQDENRPESFQAITLLPQPFSPLYWQALHKQFSFTHQAYLKLINDPIATQLSRAFGKQDYSRDFHLIENISWIKQPLFPPNSRHSETIAMVWNMPSFKPFREFAVYPVFYQYQNLADQPCYWFSDLRYHWPQFLPSFRYGMCQQQNGHWARYRMKYLSTQAVKIDN